MSFSLFRRKTRIASNANSLVASIRKKRRLKIQKVPGKLKLKTISYSERKLFLNGRVLKQKTIFNPRARGLLVKVTDRGVKVAEMQVTITKGKNSVAAITWTQTRKDLQRKGLATQMLAETLDVLKKSGVNWVRLQAIDGHGIYRAFGFSEKHQFGETYFTKQLNS